MTWIERGSAEGWIVEYATTSDFSDTIQVPSGFVTTSAPNISPSLTGLAPETTYYARIKADCGSTDGQSSWSDTLVFTPTSYWEHLKKQ